MILLNSSWRSMEARHRGQSQGASLHAKPLPVKTLPVVRRLEGPDMHRQLLLIYLGELFKDLSQAPFRDQHLSQATLVLPRRSLRQLSPHSARKGRQQLNRRPNLPPMHSRPLRNMPRLEVHRSGTTDLWTSSLVKMK